MRRAEEGNGMRRCSETGGGSETGDGYDVVQCLPAEVRSQAAFLSR